MQSVDLSPGRNLTLSPTIWQLPTVTEQNKLKKQIHFIFGISMSLLLAELLLYSYDYATIDKVRVVYP